MAPVTSSEPGVPAPEWVVWREWGIWMVRHNLKKPDEIFEVFDYDEALR